MYHPLQVVLMRKKKKNYVCGLETVCASELRHTSRYAQPKTQIYPHFIRQVAYTADDLPARFCIYFMCSPKNRSYSVESGEAKAW